MFSWFKNLFKKDPDTDIKYLLKDKYERVCTEQDVINKRLQKPSFKNKTDREIMQENFRTGYYDPELVKEQPVKVGRPRKSNSSSSNSSTSSSTKSRDNDFDDYYVSNSSNSHSSHSCCGSCSSSDSSSSSSSCD